MKKIPLSNLNTLFSRINGSRALYLPVSKNGQVDFHKWEEGTEYAKDELKTSKSAKDLFFPQSEDIVSFKREGRKLSIKTAEGSDEKFVIFGVRACDARSFEVMDLVFLADPADQFYKKRRENGLIISTACGAPEETCFCTVFGIDPAQPEGDVRTWITEEALYWEPVTEKGTELTEELRDLFEDVADTAAVDQQKARTAEIMKQLPLTGLTTDKWDETETLELFGDARWAELSHACLGCGACTFVCPTCQCYDVRDYDTGHGIQRYRCWDSCMYKDFTLMASGSSRPTQLQRFRQRFMHKLKYFPDNNGGTYMCVGCGRCVSKCPISMNIAKVMKSFGGETK